jgi:hypothetical protein
MPSKPPALELSAGSGWSISLTAVTASLVLRESMSALGQKQK